MQLSEPFLKNPFKDHPRKPYGVSLLLAFFLLTAAVRAAADPRIVAIGGVTGNYTDLVNILQRAKLINNKLDWAGGKSRLVITGDMIDGGAESRKILDLLIRLDKQVVPKGGQVIVVLGNHEVMNLVGDLRYVNPAQFAAFADVDSEQRRAQAFDQYVQFLEKRVQGSQDARVIDAQFKQKWLEAHAPGFFEYREAFGPDGEYGKWLRRRPVMARVNDYIFLHGGISPALSTLTQHEINARVWNELRMLDSLRQDFVDKGIILPFFTLAETTRFAKLELKHRTQGRTYPSEAGGEVDGGLKRSEEEEITARLKTFLSWPDWALFHSDGPVWFREYSRWSEAEGSVKVQAVLNNHRAQHIVVGHSPHGNQLIHHRFQNRVIQIDTWAFDKGTDPGNPSALEIENGTWGAIYANGRRSVDALVEELKDERTLAFPLEEASLALGVNPSRPYHSNDSAHWIGPNGGRLPFENDDDVLDFLRTAKVVRVYGIGIGITNPRKVLLEKNGVQFHAVFRDVEIYKPKAPLKSGELVFNFRDDYRFEIAAYELSKLLGIDAVPPVVRRKIQRDDGSLQVWIEGAMREKERREQNRKAPRNGRWQDQIRTMRIFDELIQNSDRNPGNLLIDNSWKVWFIDHTRAFRTDPKLVSAIRLASCDRSLWEKIQALDDSSIKQKLDPYLPNPELNAVIKRRAVIVSHLKKLIDEHGEDEVIFSN